MPPNRPRSPQRPLDPARLEELALHYAARFATSRAKLSSYLRRKLRERGWDGEREPDIGALVTRLAELRYVDDSMFAAMRGAALTRRGYGTRRVAQALDAAGIDEDDGRDTLTRSRAESWDAADALARRKRIGPYADAPADKDKRQKLIAAFVRAGHDFATAARWVDAAPGALPDRPDDS